MTRERILVVDSDLASLDGMERPLRSAGFDVLTAGHADEALSHAAADIDLVVSELWLGTQSGVELLRSWRERGFRTPFLMVTGLADVKAVVAAIKLGAEDCLTKPVAPSEIVDSVQKVLAGRNAGPFSASEKVRNLEHPGFEKLIGESPVMLEVIDRARRAAQTDSLVLILGESGTGKELIAEAIHMNSPRREGPFVAVNIAAIPRDLVESELFGHIKGSFTGATADRVGRFESAEKGTLFIDEVGDFELTAQAKLLRVLESFTITPVGSNEERQVDVRVVAATSRNLDTMIDTGEFREDLFYRLNVINIRLPPLRERRGDIPVLVSHFLSEISTTNKREAMSITPALAQVLERLDWPGNVRQLRNAIESMIVMARGNVLDVDDLPYRLRQIAQGVAPQFVSDVPTLGELEKQVTLQALSACGGNRTKAAARLGISVRTLQRRLKAWGVPSHDATSY